MHHSLSVDAISVYDFIVHQEISVPFVPTKLNSKIASFDCTSMHILIYLASHRVILNIIASVDHTMTEIFPVEAC